VNYSAYDTAEAIDRSFNILFVDVHGFHPARVRTEVVENIGQCGRLSQLSWLFGAV